jgi:hypothetical protein
MRYKKHQTKERQNFFLTLKYNFFYCFVFVIK